MKIVIISGAGLSQESGIPTFRDSDGLWHGHDVDEVANFLTWEKNYHTVHAFYNERRKDVLASQPNAAHAFYAGLEKSHNVVHLTQNVDDLLERAGGKPVHLHGDIRGLICLSCGHEWDTDRDYVPGVDFCPGCGKDRKVKPRVVFFNQMAPQYIRMTDELASLTERDLVIVVGTSGQVLNINSLLYGCPARKILNNAEESPYIHGEEFNHVIYKRATNAIRDIDAIIRSLT